MSSTQPGYPSVGKRLEYQQKLDIKQCDALARVRGLAVLAGVWLKTSEQRSAPKYGKRYHIRGVFATTRYTNSRLLTLFF